MPLINKKIISGKRVYKAKTFNPNNQAVYNTSTWRTIRLSWLSEHPLCGRCLKTGKINSAVEVHHIIPISTGKNVIEKKTLGFNIDNLESLCHQCHQNHHQKNKD